MVKKYDCLQQRIRKGGVYAVEITHVKVRKVEGGGKMKAVASIIFDDEFVVHDIKVVEGKTGLFVAMPSKKLGGSHKDIAHPLKQETRDKIFNAILEEFHEAAGVEMPDCHEAAGGEMPDIHEAASGEVPEFHEAASGEMPDFHEAASGEMPDIHEAAGGEDVTASGVSDSPKRSILDKLWKRKSG